MKREFEQHGVKYKFSHWRFRKGGGHELPAKIKGKKVTIPQEAIFTNEEGTEVGLSPLNPILNKKSNGRKN